MFVNVKPRCLKSTRTTKPLRHCSTQIRALEQTLRCPSLVEWVPFHSCVKDRRSQPSKNVNGWPQPDPQRRCCPRVDVDGRVVVDSGHGVAREIEVVVREQTRPEAQESMISKSGWRAPVDEDGLTIVLHLFRCGRSDSLSSFWVLYNWDRAFFEALLFETRWFSNEYR